MRWACWIAGMSLGLGGCVAAYQERVRDYNEDGVYLFQQGNYRDARDSFQAALTLSPNDAGLLFNLGQCQDHLGEAAGAEASYHRCLQVVPNHVAARHALAALLVRTGRTPEAAHMVQDWIEREPRLAAAYAEDGWLLRQAGDLPRAQARLQQALELDAHDPRALTELALVYETLNRPDRALVLYERLLERNPRQPELTRHVNALLAKGARRPQPE